MGSPEYHFTIKFLSCTNTLGAEIYAYFDLVLFFKREPGVATQVWK